MMKKEALNLNLLVLVLALFTVSCSGGGEKWTEQSPPSSEVEETFLDLEEVMRQARVQTLQRMLKEEDPKEVLANAGGESSKILLEVNVVLVDGGSYSVETTRTEWDITADLSQKKSISAVDSALDFAMKGNDVNWCGEPVSGHKFVQNYVDLHEGSFEANEQYEESISDYVDCGSGELDQASL
ncbi:hypothetical protein ACWFMI_00610 [Nocardiopsis terrae]